MRVPIHIYVYGTPKDPPLLEVLMQMGAAC